MNTADPFSIQIGLRIRQARINAGLTQADLADRTGIKRATIAGIENGRQRIHAQLLCTFADALATDVKNLLPAGKFPGHKPGKPTPG